MTSAEDAKRQHNSSIHQIHMTNGEFSQLSEFIWTKCEIKLELHEKTLLEVRLQRRLRKRNLTTYKDYIKYLFSPEGIENELVNMIDAVTTNKTEFIREPWHFEFLINTGLPKLIDEKGAGISRPLNVWSAGCSTGEEPYTIAIYLNEFAEKHQGFRFNIFATDISTAVLEKARLGIYKEETLRPIEQNLKSKYIMHSKNKLKKLGRIDPELRSHVRFRRLNFLDSDYGIEEKFEVVFCRNVFIYFDRETQSRILTQFCRYMKKGGYLFLGHSETLDRNLKVPLVQVAPTIYVKTK